MAKGLQARVGMASHDHRNLIPTLKLPPPHPPPPPPPHLGHTDTYLCVACLGHIYWMAPQRCVCVWRNHINVLSLADCYNMWIHTLTMVYYITYIWEVWNSTHSWVNYVEWVWSDKAYLGTGRPQIPSHVSWQWASDSIQLGNYGGESRQGCCAVLCCWSLS